MARLLYELLNYKVAGVFSFVFLVIPYSKMTVRENGYMLDEKIGSLKEFQKVTRQEYPSIPVFVVRMMKSICRNKAELPGQDRGFQSITK